MEELQLQELDYHLKEIKGAETKIVTRNNHVVALWLPPNNGHHGLVTVFDETSAPDIEKLFH